MGTLSCPALIPHPWHHRCMMTASGADNSDSPESTGVHFCCKRVLKSWSGLALRVARFLEATCPTFNKQGTRNSVQGDVFSQNCLLHHLNSPHPLSPGRVLKEGAELQENRNLSEREEA